MVRFLVKGKAMHIASSTKTSISKAFVMGKENIISQTLLFPYEIIAQTEVFVLDFPISSSFLSSLIGQELKTIISAFSYI